jgi:hypothetical protein
MNLGPIETFFLFIIVLFTVLVAKALTLRFPSLIDSLKNRWSIIGLLVCESIFLLWGILNSFPTPDPGDPLPYYLVHIPSIGNIALTNIIEGIVLTVACLLIQKQGVLRVTLFVLPLWYGFHDGLYYLIIDSSGGNAPFVYSQMLQTFPTAYFGQFLVDIWQAFAVILVLNRLVRSHDIRVWMLAIFTLVVNVCYVLSSQVNTVWQPGNILGHIPYMTLYTVFIYLVLRPPELGVAAL